MADSSSFDNIRTLDELINMASKIFFNMNAMNEAYYDIFLNPEAKTINLERYDDTGKLITVPIKNRAAELNQSYSGVGTPEGAVEAKVGAIYIDTSAANAYYKSSGEDAYGWVLFWSANNFLAGTNYLAPDGNGKDLQTLNADNISSGTLLVARGGTGNATLSGILKGNGTSPISTAVEGTDYIGPATMTGIICYYPVNTSIPTGWLRCDGSAYSRTTYANLYSIIGTTYGSGDGSTTFNVPNLLNHFIRCWDGNSEFNTVQQPVVGQHNHAISLTTGSESAHTHGRGTMNITGSLYVSSEGREASGAFTYENYGSRHEYLVSSGVKYYFDASRSWSGSTSGGSAHSHSVSGNTANYTGTVTENRVLNKMLVPIIKY